MKPSEANAIFPLDEAPPADRPSDDDDAPEIHDLPKEDVVRRIMKDVMVRRARGELLSDERVLAEHPAHLHPQIREELDGLRMIHRVLQAARKAGPLDDAIAPLDTAQLEAPIDPPPEHQTPWDDPTRPLHVAGYQILSEVSRGGQATVFKAIQEVTGRRVAIKVLTGGALAGSRHRARFEREAQALALLDHPNVVGILDRGRTVDGSFYLAMPFIDGCPLDEYAAETQATDADFPVPILRTFIKIARAVEEAHRLGIIHRDLKPSNIRIDAHGEPHLLDFGLARILEPDTPHNAHDARTILTLDKQVLGSLPWTSPEQADGGAARVDARGDVYALGVCLYQSLTGRFPYPVGGSMTEVVRHITSTPAAPLRWTSVNYERVADLEAVLARALAKSPEHRYARAADLAIDLEALLEGDATQASKGFLFPLSRWLRPVLWGLIACFAVAFAWSLRKRPAPTVPPVTPVNLPAFQNKLDMRMVRVPAGEFWMGSPGTAKGRSPDEALHRVNITQDFWVGDSEVTRGQFRQLMRYLPESAEAGDDSMPVTGVTWLEANEFCARLSKLDGRTYGLPTEAQWEYACRAGAQTPFAGSNSPNQLGWFLGAATSSSLHTGRLKQPNHWNLFDFHGNAAEWCDDRYVPVYPSSPDDPYVGGDFSQPRVVRGGSFSTIPNQGRSAARDKLDPYKSKSDLGFRVVIKIPPPSLAAPH